MKGVFTIGLTVILFLALVHADAPGFKTTLTQAGLTYAKDVGIQLLEEDLSKLQIPDQSGDNSGFSWWITSLKLNGVRLPTSSVTLVPNVGLQLAMSGVAATLNFDWKYRQDGWPHISDHGNGYVSISASSAEAEIHMFDSGGRPQVNVIQDGVSLNNFDVHVNGGPSWLYNLLIGLFKGQIKDAVTKALENAIKDGINNGLNKVLGGLPVLVSISREAELDYALVADLDFSRNYLTLPLLGEFYMKGNHQECPAPRNPLPDAVTGNMVQLMLNEFVAISAGFTFWKLGKLTVQVTDKDLPSWSPVRLNTTSFQFTIPNLYKAYPNAAMVIQISSQASPNAQFSPSGATVSAYGFLTVFVIQNNQLVNAFVLNGTVAASGTAYLQGQTIVGNLTFLNVNFALYSSNIGSFDPRNLNSLLNTLFQYGVVPAVNVYLKQGFPLPVVPGLTFVNPKIGWGNHFLYVATDVKYQVPANFNPIYEAMTLQKPGKIAIQIS